MQLVPPGGIFTFLGTLKKTERTNTSTNCIHQCRDLEYVHIPIVPIATIQIFFYNTSLKPHEIKLNHE